MRRIWSALFPIAIVAVLLVGCSNGTGDLQRISTPSEGTSDAIGGADDGMMGGMHGGDMGMCDSTQCTCPDHDACGMMDMHCVPDCPGCGGSGCDGSHDGGMGGCNPDSCHHETGGHEHMEQGGDDGHQGGHMGY